MSSSKPLGNRISQRFPNWIATLAWSIPVVLPSSVSISAQSLIDANRSEEIRRELVSRRSKTRSKRKRVSLEANAYAYKRELSGSNKQETPSSALSTPPENGEPLPDIGEPLPDSVEDLPHIGEPLLEIEADPSVEDASITEDINSFKQSSGGELSVEGRAFLDDDDSRTRDMGAGLFSRLEWSGEYESFNARLRAFGRLDAIDRGRDLIVIEETWIQFRESRFRVRVGADIVNWTATETFHPVDVVNARNLDSDLENQEKIGEPMVALQVGLFEGSTASAMFMPVYMKTRFPSPASRLNFVPAQNLGATRVLIDRLGSVTEETFGPQAVLRLHQVIGSADISVHAMEHMDRSQPLLFLDPNLGRIVPVFQTVRQVGGTYQHVFDSLIIKLECAYRWFQQPINEVPGILPISVLTGSETTVAFPYRDHAAVALGFEYGLVHDAELESAFFLEAQSIFGPGAATRRQLSPFQRDLFVGYRLSVNDEDTKDARAGVIVDLEQPRELLIDLSYRQRLGEAWSALIGARIVFAREQDGPYGLVSIRDADHVRMTITRHF